MEKARNDPLFPQELIFQGTIGSATDAVDETTTSPGGVEYPEFIFPMTIGSGPDEEELWQQYINAAVRVPVGSTSLKWMWRAKKKNGNYGPKHFGEIELDELQSELGHVEFQMFGGDAFFPDNKRVDILRLIADTPGGKRRSPQDKNLVPTSPPPDVAGQVTGTVVSNPPALATALFGDFAPGVIFIRSVGTPTREKTGIEQTLVLGISRNLEWVKVAFARVGRKTDPAGGPFTYGRKKQSEAHYTTREEREDTTYGDGFGTVTVTLTDLKPFTSYDVLRLIGAVRTFSGDNDDAGGKEHKFRIPANPDDVATDPQDMDPNNDGAGHAYLARFDTGQEIDSTPNPPRGEDLVRNSPDFTTEKADAIQGYRVWADDSDHNRTFAQVFANRVFVKVRLQGATDDEVQPSRSSAVHTYEQILTVEEQQQTHYVLYDTSRLGRKWDWFKTGISNASDRSTATGSYPFRSGAASNDHLLIQMAAPLIIHFDPVDNRRLKFRFVYNILTDAAGNAPVPAKLRIFESDGVFNGPFHLEKADEIKGELDDAGVDMATPGSHTKTYSVKRPANAERWYYGDLRVIGDPVRVETNHISSLSAADPTGTGGQDTVKPPPLAQPRIAWKRKQGFRLKVAKPNKATDGYRGDLTFEWQVASTNTATLLTNPATVMEEDGTLVAIGFVDPTEYPITSPGHVHYLPIKRNELAAGIRAGTTPLYVRVRARNVVNNVEQIGDWSVWSNAMSPAIPERDSYNDDEGIAVKKAHHTVNNLCEGGAGAISRGATRGYNNYAGANPELIMGRNWRVGSAANALTANHVDNIANADAAAGAENFLRTAAKFGIAWDQANHRVEFTTSGSVLACILGRHIHAGRWLSASWLMGALAAITLTDMQVGLAVLKNSNNGAGTNGPIEVIDVNPLDGASSYVSYAAHNPTGPALPAVSVAVPYVFMGVTFKIPNAFAAAAADRTAALLFKPTWAGAANVYMDDIMACYGKSIRAYAPGALERQLDAEAALNASTPHGAFAPDSGILNDFVDDHKIAIFTV